jgi:DNA-binding transcriptional LysR family regulator
LNVRRKRIDTLLNTHGIHVAEMLEMDGMLVTLEMIGSTDWVAILPWAICHPDRTGDVRQLNPIKDPPIRLDYVLVEKTESAPPQAARLLADCLTQHIAHVLSDETAGIDIGNPEPLHHKI